MKPGKTEKKPLGCETKELMEFLLKPKHKKDIQRINFKIRVWNFTVRSAYLLKRCFDLVGSLILLVCLSPVFLITAIWVKLDSPGPLIYRQVRVGLNGRHFYFYKFRSMYVDADKRRKELEEENESGDGVIFKMKRDPRITLCGPRPPLPQEVDLYTLDDRKRLQILPGITCIWQISGRSDIPFHQQVMLDKEYIKSQSIWKDLLILLKTIPAVLTGRGAY